MKELIGFYGTVEIYQIKKMSQTAPARITTSCQSHQPKPPKKYPEVEQANRCALQCWSNQDQPRRGTRRNDCASQFKEHHKHAVPQESGAETQSDIRQLGSWWCIQGA
jgi:hypothetical protein